MSDGLRHLFASDELGCALHAVADDWVQSELSQFGISECDAEVLVADLQSKCAVVSVKYNRHFFRFSDSSTIHYISVTIVH